MIPYDDLVAALQSWRARQGLPVSGVVPTAAPAAVASTPGSGPRTSPPAAPRTNPPAPPRAPMPLAAPEHSVDEALDVEDAHMLDEQVYENEGDDFAMAFGKNESAEATQIGEVPAPEPTDPGGPTRGNPDREDW